MSNKRKTRQAVLKTIAKGVGRPLVPKRSENYTLVLRVPAGKSRAYPVEADFPPCAGSQCEKGATVVIPHNGHFYGANENGALVVCGMSGADVKKLLAPIDYDRESYSMLTFEAIVRKLHNGIIGVECRTRPFKLISLGNGEDAFGRVSEEIPGIAVVYAHPVEPISAVFAFRTPDGEVYLWDNGRVSSITLEKLNKHYVFITDARRQRPILFEDIPWVR